VLFVSRLYKYGNSPVTVLFIEKRIAHYNCIEIGSVLKIVRLFPVMCKLAGIHTTGMDRLRRRWDAIVLSLRDSFEAMELCLRRLGQLEWQFGRLLEQLGMQDRGHPFSSTKARPSSPATATDPARNAGPAPIQSKMGYVPSGPR
jgi:hypothetical protein